MFVRILISHIFVLVVNVLNLNINVHHKSHVLLILFNVQIYPVDYHLINV